jgi:uncharacterized protein
MVGRLPLDRVIAHDASGPVGRRVRRNRYELVAAAAAHSITGCECLAAWPAVMIVQTAMLICSRICRPGLSLFGLGRVEAELEDILSARVDLAPAESLKPQIRKRVEQELVPL